MTFQITGVTVPREDVDAILALVATVEEAQQKALPDPFLKLFRPEAIWTTGHGRRLFGLGAIGDFTRRVLPGAIDHPTTATYDVEHIVFIRPDVAAVKVRQRPVTRDGRRLDEVFRGHPDPSALAAENPEALPGTPMYVLSKDDGEWRIAAAQNTAVVDPGSLSA
ncbi:SgcJ/EcaC family oxidoreductase [Streptosporangium longisporum]|uniref:SgcJ/EcaC family oxidoreductase n=1 Tax=Streptosporangium longisporum TaxID=46187 RepID=A0ABP6LI24_9ACTN